MRLVRHLTAERLEADVAVSEARSRLAEAQSAAQGLEAQGARAGTEARAALEAELSALAAEVQGLRRLRTEAQAGLRIDRPEAIDLDPADDDVCIVEAPGEAAFHYRGADLLEQVQAMMTAKAALMAKKRAELRRLLAPDLSAPPTPARAASDRAVRRLRRQQACVGAACADLEAAEARRKDLDAAVDAARAQCVDGALVLRVGVVPAWHAAAAPPSWSVVDQYVETEWALRCGSDLLPLADSADLLAAISSARMVPGHILEVTTNVDTTLHVRVGAGDAGEMLLKARTPPPRLNSLDVLKAAVGASPGVALCDELVKFYRGCIAQEGRGKGILSQREVPLPLGLAGELRPYQRAGFSWLARNLVGGFGCILADDMGLGKTVQCITTLLHLKEQSHLPKPALIVAPVSLMYAWASEISKWAPSLVVHLYHGQHRQLLACARRTGWTPRADGWMQRRRSLAAPRQRRKSACLARPASRAATRPVSGCRADVFLTSYGTLRSDATCLLEQQRFSAMILDEAQAIRNSSSQLSRSAKRLAAEVPVRIAISGTPVENRASDLHSLFEYTMPGYLGSRASFEARYGRPLSQKNASEESACSLQQLAGPFMLRRMKTDPKIAKDLPPKVEQTHFVDLAPSQLELYRRILAASMTAFAGGLHKAASRALERGQTLPELFQRPEQTQQVEPSVEASQKGAPAVPTGQEKFTRAGNVFRIMHALRQVCNHPSNLDFEKWPELKELAAPPDDVQASGKTALLEVLLEQIFAQSGKVVIFCQYLKTIDMLASHIASRFGVKAQTLVGELSGPERARRVRDFQRFAGRGAIVSTLGVGGAGITLHAASHVIHFDRCYNPARESQGSDRVHRIGQAASCVFVHRLVARGTFEERMDGILEQKRRLCGLAVPAGENWVADLSDAELRALFALAAGRGARPADGYDGALARGLGVKRHRAAESLPASP